MIKNKIYYIVASTPQTRGIFHFFNICKFPLFINLLLKVGPKLFAFVYVSGAIVDLHNIFDNLKIDHIFILLEIFFKEKVFRQERKTFARDSETPEPGPVTRHRAIYGP